LLTAITVKKVLNLKQRHSRLKRGGGLHGVSRLEPVAVEGAEDCGLPGSTEGLAAGPGKEIPPALQDIPEEEVEILLAALDDPMLRRIAVGRLEGLSNAEIAGELGCAVRTVERKLERIRAIWTEAGLGPE